MTGTLSIVYRAIATHLSHKAGLTKPAAQTGAVTLIQHFGSAVSSNVHFHMLFLDGVYVERSDGSLRFRWVRAPTSTELAGLTQTLAQRLSLTPNGMPAAPTTPISVAGWSQYLTSMVWPGSSSGARRRRAWKGRMRYEHRRAS